MKNNITIKKATKDDFTNLKSLLLDALEKEPFAFSSDYSEYAVNRDYWWQNYLFGYLHEQNSCMFLVFKDEILLGCGGVIFNQQNRKKHIASIVWIYLDSTIRGIGIGKDLFSKIMEEIRLNKSIKKVNLMINTTQISALNLYKSFGFEVVGTLKKELILNDQFIDEYIMELFIWTKALDPNLKNKDYYLELT